MSLKKDYYKQMQEFNSRVFKQKLKYRSQLAMLPFEDKIKIIDELYAFAEKFKSPKRHIKKRSPSSGACV